MARTVRRGNKRRLTVISKRREWDSARFAEVLAAYVLAQVQAEAQANKPSDEASA